MRCSLYSYYSYEGPVVNRFGVCIANCWSGCTCASSEKKARSNLAYQYKKQHKLSTNASVTLPGKLTVIVDYVAS